MRRAAFQSRRAWLPLPRPRLKRRLAVLSPGVFMDIRFVTAGSGDVVAVMASEGAQLMAAGQALDTASGGRIAKAMKASRFTGGAGQVVDVLAPDGVDFSRVLVIGVGKPDGADGLAVERWAGHAVK